MGRADPAWQSYVKADLPPPKSCDQCSHRYDGEYSTHVYTRHVQGLLSGWKPADAPIFLYMAWQVCCKHRRFPCFANFGNAPSF